MIKEKKAQEKIVMVDVNSNLEEINQLLVSGFRVVSKDVLSDKIVFHLKKDSLRMLNV